MITHDTKSPRILSVMGFELLDLTTDFELSTFIAGLADESQSR